MKIDAIKTTSLAREPKLPDRFLGGTLVGSGRLCSVFLSANEYGLDVYLPFDITVTWRGGCKFDVEIENDAILKYIWTSEMESLINIPSYVWCSKISGVLQIDVGWIWRTDPDVKLLLTGAINQPSPAYTTHVGILDSDWFHLPSTVNLQFFRQDETVEIKSQHPIARLVPLVNFEEGQNIELKTISINDEPSLLEPWKKYIREVYGKFDRNHTKRIHHGVYLRWKTEIEYICPVKSQTYVKR
ncbi:hypothetical protein Xbed_00620 [Xenorhabdus beddingii]|uniref:Uncharacterized protein n=1 Tax=Xenorhabdus beddingii TaxID=40578 RepID=A0A1Y2ST54_9GAMM|nr:DUF6065 family protein [Xenorhabdus beddingii]OTA21391.1 hypothetical protein Xbed_00620 [Xenorhabdus beddingii]